MLDGQQINENSRYEIEMMQQKINELISNPGHPCESRGCPERWVVQANQGIMRRPRIAEIQLTR
jgi:hypothetical protein